MQNILPVACFIAGFLLAWLVLRRRRNETESAFKALSADALARNNQAFLDLARADAGANTGGRARRPGSPPPGHRGDGDAGARVARKGGFADSGARDRPRGRLRRALRAGPRPGRNPGPAPRRNRQAGHRAAHPGRARPLGRNPVAARGGDGRHAGPLRFPAQIDRRPGGWPPAAGSAGAPARRQNHRGGCQDPARWIPRGHRSIRRARAPGAPGRSCPPGARPHDCAGPQIILGAIRPAPPSSP